MNTRSYTFRDAELQSKPLRLINHVGQALSHFGLKFPKISEQSIVDQAVARAKCSDFGSDSYREPLGQYLSSITNEAELNTFGRIVSKGMLVNALANRLKLIDWHKKNPNAKKETIKQPWIILGLPRTGTSLLSILLGLSPMARPLQHWEAANPMPPADLARAGEDPRITECAKDIDALLNINPPLGAMHPFGATIAEECTAVFMYDLRTVGMETVGFAPSYGQWLSNADMTSAYDLHKLTLQALQSTQPTDQWVLKSPNHLWCLDELLAAYPDARIIWTHRNPSTVIPSIASLTNALQWPGTTRRDPKPAAEDWKLKMSNAIDKGVTFDDKQKSNWCYHLRYDDLIANPISAVDNIYRHFGVELGELQQQRIKKWVEHRPQNTFGRHHYSAEDFGWTSEQLGEEFEVYSRRYC
tara:strand:- start:195 stop:1436 length:1242 start_codon:yes stop_codon:yes gene_type:complete